MILKSAISYMLPILITQCSWCTYYAYIYERVYNECYTRKMLQRLIYKTSDYSVH